MSDTQGTGCRQPPDNRHVELYRLASAVPEAVAFDGHLKIRIPRPKGLRRHYNQGQFGACVGASLSQLVTIYNSNVDRDRARLYDWEWLWNEAKRIDPWPDTNPGDNRGTALRSGLDVLRKQGHRIIKSGTARKPRARHGVESYYWATTVDEVRAILAIGQPVAVASPWFESMSSPRRQADGSYRMDDTGSGSQYGHAWIIDGGDDDREAFFMPQTWSESWAEPGPDGGAWVPYRLLDWIKDRTDWLELGVVLDLPKGERAR